MARPKKNDAKRLRLEVRLNEEEMKRLEKCADEIGTTKSGVLLIGLQLVDSVIQDMENEK